MSLALCLCLGPVCAKIFAWIMLKCLSINKNRAAHGRKTDHGKTLHQNPPLAADSARKHAEFEHHIHRRVYVRERWVTVTEEKLILRNKAYWLSLRGFPETTN